MAHTCLKLVLQIFIQQGAPGAGAPLAVLVPISETPPKTYSYAMPARC